MERLDVFEEIIPESCFTFKKAESLIRRRWGKRFFPTDPSYFEKAPTSGDSILLCGHAGNNIIYSYEFASICQNENYFCFGAYSLIIAQYMDKIFEKNKFFKLNLYGPNDKGEKFFIKPGSFLIGFEEENRLPFLRHSAGRILPVMHKVEKNVYEYFSLPYNATLDRDEIYVVFKRK